MPCACAIVAVHVVTVSTGRVPQLHSVSTPPAQIASRGPADVACIATCKSVILKAVKVAIPRHWMLGRHAPVASSLKGETPNHSEDRQDEEVGSSLRVAEVPKELGARLIINSVVLAASARLGTRQLSRLVPFIQLRSQTSRVK
jgi:hypothetical protein